MSDSLLQPQQDRGAASFEQLTHQEIRTYDMERYPFRRLVEEMLGRVRPLEKLHTHQTAVDWARPSSHQKKKRYLSNPFSKKLYSLSPEFKAAYRSFCIDFLPTMLGGEREFCFQAHPTMRVIFPSEEAAGIPHCDFDYKHVKSEINFWIPLVAVGGSNTLWTESVPGKGDYSPIVSKNGEVIRFYGNQCRHFTVPNKTSTTRVSFDLRVIPASQYNLYPQHLLPNNRIQFQIGQYYDYTDNFCEIVGIPQPKSRLKQTRKSAVCLAKLIASLQKPSRE